MRNIRSMILTGIMAVAVTLALSPEVARADSQGMPSTMGTATNLPSTVAAASVTNQTSFISLRANRGLALQWKFNASGGTGTSAIWVYPSVDGTNIGTTALSVLTGSANTNNDIVVYGNWSRAALEGYTALSVGAMSNGIAATYVLTNKGVIWNFPNN